MTSVSPGNGHLLVESALLAAHDLEKWLWKHRGVRPDALEIRVVRNTEGFSLEVAISPQAELHDIDLPEEFDGFRVRSGHFDSIAGVTHGGRMGR